jgi:2'-5' RNA ligase
VARGRRTLGIQRAANFRRLEIAFALPLGDDAHNYMRQLQVTLLKKHGFPEGLTAPPHITLKLGFKTSDLGVYEAYLDELARTTPPFLVHLSGVDSFGEGIIFLGVEPNPVLEQLRRRVVCDLSQRFAIEPRPLEGDQFRFHATLAHGLPPRTFQREVQRLSQLAPRFAFQASSVAILCQAADHWITYRRAALRAPADVTART